MKNKHKLIVKKMLEVLPDKINRLDLINIYCYLGFQVGMILSKLDYLPTYKDLIEMYKEEEKIGLFIIIQSYKLLELSTAK
jgi:hypothetical protein